MNPSANIISNVDFMPRIKTFTPTDFDLFWSAYPHKVAKLAARRAFCKASVQDASIDDILKGIDNYKANKPPSQAWCHPASFLNGMRWNDEYAPPVAATPSASVLAIQQQAELTRVEARLEKLRGLRPFKPGDKPAVEFEMLLEHRKKLIKDLNWKV
jgi:hypothetical protein